MSHLTRNETPKRKNLLRAGAFAMVALIVAVAAHGVYQYQADNNRLNGSASEDAGALDPALVLSDLDGRVGQIQAATDVDATGEAQAAFGDVDATIGTTEAHVLFLADDAQRTVAGATGASSLPAVPEGFVPGAPVEVDAVTGVTYRLEGFADLGAAELQAFEEAWLATALQLAGDDDVAREQLESIMAEADGATGGQDPVGDLTSDPIVQPIWIIGESTYDTARTELSGAGAPTGSLPDDLGTDVGSPSEILGAASPAEAEAQQAYGHAVQLLDQAFFLVGEDLAGTTGAEVGAMGEYVAFIEGHQTGLVDIVNDTIELTNEELVRQTADVQARAEEAMAAIDAQAQADIDETMALAAARQATLTKARADAEAFLDSQVEADLQNILDTAALEAGDLRAQADDVEALADVAVAQVGQAETEAQARLDVLAAQGVDTTAQAAELEAMVAEARAAIQAEAEADAALLRDQADALEAHAASEVARLQGHVDEVRAELAAEVEAAIADTKERAQYAVALTQAEAEATIQAHQEAATQAISDLGVMANEHVFATYETALDLNAEAGAVLQTAEATRLALLEDVGFTAMDQTNLIAEDLAIVQDVAEDCGTSQGQLCDTDWEAAADLLAALQSDAVVASEFRGSDITSAAATIDGVRDDLLGLSLV